MCNQFNQSTPINYDHIICNFLLKLHIFSCNLATETPLNIDPISFAYYITLITYIETCLYFRYWKGGEKTHEVRGTIEFSLNVSEFSEKIFVITVKGLESAIQPSLV